MNYAVIGVLMSVMMLNMAQAGDAMQKRVTFKNGGQTLVGVLYLPADYEEGQQLPGVIVSGSWTSVKEQMAGAYAEKLAAIGYAALAFDFRGWGESNQNSPLSIQFVEHPGEKTSDILAAAAFMSGRDEVDSSRIATLGICASAGYAIDAAHQSDLINATAVVAPWLHDAEIVDEVYGDAIPALLQATAGAIETGQPVFLDAAGEPGSDAVMQGVAYYTDPGRGAIPEYDNQFSTLSWEPWLTYDAIQTASKISDPVFMLHSDAAAIPQGARKFADQGGDNVQLIMLDDVSQFDFYDNEPIMDTAVGKVDEYLDEVFM